MARAPVLYEKLYSYVLDEIRSGTLQPGDRVPSEKELADRFSVSRITSKKALETLERAGVIERIRGKGSFVIESSPSLPQLPATRSSAARRSTGCALLGLILPDASDAYGLKLLNGVEDRCSELGCHLILKRTHGRREVEEVAIDDMVRSGIDGLIVFPVHGEYYNARLVRLVLDSYPLVLVDRYLNGIAASAVYTDNVAASAELTGYLLDRGHRHIAFLSPPAHNTSSIEERIQGFRDVFSRRDLGERTQRYLTNLYSTLPDAFRPDNIGADEEAIRQFIEANPCVTAFVACEYNIALILARVLTAVGKRVPEDYAIVCFDSPDEPFGEPLFTHVRQDETAMGRAAVDSLIAQLHGKPVATCTVVGFQMVEGRSAPANR